MISCKIYGNPISTGAVIYDEGIESWRLEEKSLPRERFFSWNLEERDIVYGLGEVMGGINKRGKTYISYNTDDPHHREDMPSMYGAHNFFIIDGSVHVGVFVDTPARTTFAVDDGTGRVDVTVDSPDVRLYLIEAASAYEITREFLAAIGPSFVPPLWAFGFGQSRWGYKTKKDIDRVIAGYQRAGIPLDYVCMDIDYMDRYIDFTVNEKRFPNLADYVAEKKAQGIRLVPIIDAGVKVEQGNPTYEAGVENDFFCKNERGEDFVGAVWPGPSHFPDFFQEKARAWFGEEYKSLVDCGIEGFWNDMNEPSIFYGEHTKKPKPWDTVLDFLVPSRAESQTANKNQAYEEYAYMYHSIDGKRVCHHQVHNLYGALMTRASGEGLGRLMPQKRYLLFSRSSYIGAHRYGGIWTGDNHSDFAMLRQNLYQMAGLNMCGFLYSGADTGGFGGSCTRELLLRWLALSVFTPLMRNHSAVATRKQECYAFGDTEDFRRIVALRYRLLPYLYSEFLKARKNCDMYMKPLGFVFDQDAAAKACEDQLFVGEGIMIAPVLEEKATARRVYLPEEMMEVRFDGDCFAQTVREAGQCEISVPLNEVVFFIRKDRAIIVTKTLSTTTSDMDLSAVERLGYDVDYVQVVDD